MDNAPTVERARLSVVAARDDCPAPFPPPETSYIGYNGYKRRVTFASQTLDHETIIHDRSDTRESYFPK